MASSRKGNPWQSFALILSILCCFSGQKVFPLQWAEAEKAAPLHIWADTYPDPDIHTYVRMCTYMGSCGCVGGVAGILRSSKSAYNLN